MRQYELTVLIHPDLEMNLQPALDKIAKIIESAGGKITKETNEGKRHLAYRVCKQDFAVYYFFSVSLPAEAPGKLSSTLNITDEVLRYLLVRADEKRAKEIEKAEGETKEETKEEKGE